MKTDKNIWFAFLLNLGFSLLELFGGIYTGSVAILSDAVHDALDAVSIGLAFVLERKSKKQVDEIYTYGYVRYSVLGSLIMTVLLVVGSLILLYHSVSRIITPTVIRYDGMLLFACIGICVNSFAAFFTHHKHSLNQKAVYLHMLEDILGWVVVLIGALFMKFTNIVLLDPIMSISLAVFILISAFKNLKEALDVLLERTPSDIDTSKIKMQIAEIPGVLDVHHLHIWSIDGQSGCATMHIVVQENICEIKKQVRNKLLEYKITHITIETESKDDLCFEPHCHISATAHHAHHHHHH